MKQWLILLQSWLVLWWILWASEDARYIKTSICKVWTSVLQTHSSTSTMVLSQFIQTINPFSETLGLVKVASIGLVVALLVKIIKTLTTPSPYQHIPGPKPSNSTLGMLDLIPNNSAQWCIWQTVGYLLDMHNPDDVDFHFKMTQRYGHVARLKAGIIGVRQQCIYRWTRKGTNSHSVVGWPLHIGSSGFAYNSRSWSKHFPRVGRIFGVSWHSFHPFPYKF